MKNFRPASLSRTLALVPPAIALVVQQASGAFEAFIKIGDINGESTSPKHEDWIDGMSFSFGVSKEISHASASSKHGKQGDGNEHRTPSASPGAVTLGPTITSELTLSKRLDRSSPNLFLGCATGTKFPSVTIDLVNTLQKGVGLSYYRITLTDVYVSRISQEGTSGDEKPTELVSLNFSNIKIEYFDQDEKGGNTGTPTTVGWDIGANKKAG